MQAKPERGIDVKILHITNAFDVDGTGISNMLADLSLEQVLRGHEVSIMSWSRNNELTDRLAAESIGILTIPAWNRGKSLWHVAREVRAAEAFRRADVIHVHTVRAYGTLLSSMVPRAWTRSIATMHNPFQRSSLLMLSARRPVSVSRRHSQQLTRKLGIFGRRARVVLNGTFGTKRLVPLGQAKPRTLAGEYRFLFVGGLIGRKGIETLVQIMERIAPEYPDAHLYIVGNRDNPEFECRVAASSAALNIHLEGFVADPREYMLACDVFVFPSQVEAFGLVLTEARSCGMAVLASDIDGIPEALDMGRAGLLLPPTEVAEWVGALTALCADSQTLQRWKDRAREGIEAFSVESMASEYEDLYDTLR